MTLEGSTAVRQAWYHLGRHGGDLGAHLRRWRVRVGGPEARPTAHLSEGEGEGRSVRGPSLERPFGLILGVGPPLPLRPICAHLSETPPPSPFTHQWGAKFQWQGAKPLTPRTPARWRHRCATPSVVRLRHHRTGTIVRARRHDGAAVQPRLVPAARSRRPARASVLFTVGHFHTGGVNISRSVNDRHVCTSYPTYGTQPGVAGDEQGYLVRMSHCLDAASGALELKKGDRLTVDAFYYASAEETRACSTPTAPTST